MFDVRDVHTELCVLQQVKDYLSFVAPVGYATAFHFRKTIHKHAETLACKHTGDKVVIQEYNVTINGSSIFKKYAPSFTTSKGDDKITEVDFHDFYDDDGNLIAWLWFGISRFQGVLKKENQMRGIRLRTQNIQIGDDNALQKLFSEDRGQHYFVGEVFAISKDLIPNSQRDYFNENEARVKFELLLSNFFNDDLSRIYKAGSNINSKYDKIVKAETIEAEISAKADAGESVSAEDIARVKKSKKEAEVAVQELDKIRKNTENKLEGNEFGTVEVVVSEIIKSNEEKRASSRPAVPVKPLTSKLTSVTVDTPQVSISKAPPRGIIAGDEAVSKSDKLISIAKIREIIRRVADSSIADAIIAKIEEEID
jgi:molecular chaperone HtpG